MRYLRMVTNAIAAGFLAAVYLTVLVLQINPHVPVVSATALRWFVALLALYGPYVSVIILLLILAREAIASRPLLSRLAQRADSRVSQCGSGGRRRAR